MIKQRRAVLRHIKKVRIKNWILGGQFRFSTKTNDPLNAKFYIFQIQSNGSYKLVQSHRQLNWNDRGGPVHGPPLAYSELQPVDTFIQLTVDGLTLGSVYALIALGYTLVYGVLKLLNFAHGDVFMVGTFIGFGVLQLLGGTANPIGAGLAAARARSRSPRDGRLRARSAS